MVGLPAGHLYGVAEKPSNSRMIGLATAKTLRSSGMGMGMTPRLPTAEWIET